MLSLRVITPTGLYRQMSVESFNLKTVEGERTILAHHIPLFAAISPCPLRVRDGAGKVDEYALSGGFLRFENNEALIITDAIEGRDDIDIERAREAYRRARERLEKQDKLTNMKRASLSLQRAINRIRIYEDH